MSDESMTSEPVTRTDDDEDPMTLIARARGQSPPDLVHVDADSDPVALLRAARGDARYVFDDEGADR